MSDQETTFKILSNGDVVTLYNDDDAILRSLGPKEVQRASNVLFSTETQQWEVVLNLPDSKQIKLPVAFDKRGDAIEYEKVFLHDYLTGPEATVENLFQSHRLEMSEATHAAGEQAPA